MHIFFQNNQYLGSYYFTRSADDPVNVKALVGAYNQDKAQPSVLVGAFSVIVKTGGSFAAPVILLSGET